MKIEAKEVTLVASAEGGKFINCDNKFKVLM